MELCKLVSACPKTWTICTVDCEQLLILVCVLIINLFERAIKMHFFGIH